MKTLSCRDMGEDDDFVARGMTEDEVLNKMIEHHRKMHSEKMSGMSDDEMMKMKGMMRGKIMEG